MNEITCARFVIVARRLFGDLTCWYVLMVVTSTSPVVQLTQEGFHRFIVAATRKQNETLSDEGRARRDQLEAY